MTAMRAAIIDIATSKKLPTMFADRETVAKGALVSYGASYYAFGRVAAKNVHRILLGANPAELPVEQLDRPHLIINLNTAKALGLAIPHAVLVRADEVIQ
jgi:putative ABC transport system substrate-binding protein